MAAIIVTRNNFVMLHRFIDRTHSEFAIKGLCRLNYFLGLEVSYTGDGLFVGQAKYAHDILDRAKLVNPKPITTPLVSGESLVSSVVPFEDLTLYGFLVGALQYLTITRLDLFYV